MNTDNDSKICEMVERYSKRKLIGFPVLMAWIVLINAAFGLCVLYLNFNPMLCVVIITSITMVGSAEGYNSNIKMARYFTDKKSN
jgi:hypothetical protein